MEKDLKGHELVETRVGNGILITGRIEGDGNVVIQGRVDGEVRIKGDLQIDVTGQVKADVSARNVFVYGVLVGNAEAVEKVEIAEGGRMVGDVRAPRMLINEGAAFRGMVDMVDFETDERPGEPRKTPRRVAPPLGNRPSPPRPAATPPFSAPRRATPPRPAATKPRESVSDAPVQKGLYSAPPLPKPPEFAGARKAIIIKKKPSTEGA